MKHYTPDQKREALAKACVSVPNSVCSKAESCPMCGVCDYFAGISDKEACELYAEAVKRGAIKEEQ